jgi:AcrR family transcriptional regulator
MNAAGWQSGCMRTLEELHHATLDPDESPERGRHDKEGRQQALMAAAVSVFAEHGYEAATTREIAERASCSEGLIHRYFGGKRGLMLAALESKHMEVAEDFTAHFNELGEDAPLVTEIERMLTWPIERMVRKQDFMRVSVGQSVIDPEVGRIMGDGVNHYRTERVRERLTLLQEAGRIRPDVETAAMAEAICGLSFAFGFMSAIVFQRDPQRVREHAVAAARVLARGMEPAGGPE